MDAVNSVLTGEAREFLDALQRAFNPERERLLDARSKRFEELVAGKKFSLLPETAKIRKDPNWRVAATPPDLQKRWVEITGPTDKKMLINALNSGADIFMADFEDSLSPTWNNVVEGQLNLTAAIQKNLTFESAEGKRYSLNPKTAVLLVRPRGWHLPEKHYLVDGKPISASLFDFGLYFFRNAKALIEQGTGPYFYLPKMESHLEARLWNEVFKFAQKELNIPYGTIRATVLIETIPAAFEMEEILYELRDHSSGLNAGRWDYIFSTIKKFRTDKEVLFPDRGEITMSVPFMSAYTDLLVRTCHKRGAHAMGGMAAFIPSRKDPEVNKKALTKVQEDKDRESLGGFDGTWVAHPDLVSLAHETFKRVLKEKPHQKDKVLANKTLDLDDLLDFRIPGGKITERGVRQNIRVALQYIESWLNGVGAVAIENLMEDAATAEISRAQLWQWLHHSPEVVIENGPPFNIDIYNQWADEEQAHLPSKTKLEAARRLLDRLVLDGSFAEFLTLLAYEQL